MVRHTRLLVVVGLIALAVPASSSAVSTQFVELTPTGPSPVTVTIVAGDYPIWRNTDTVSHNVAFPSGCSIDVAPGDVGQCDVPQVVGDYPYTVDGTIDADVSVVPAGRVVTLTAKRHGFYPGSSVRLHGVLAIEGQSPPAFYGPRMPVTVYALPKGHHLWYRLATVMSEPIAKPEYPAHSVWQLLVKPHGPTTYRVEATSQPDAGQYWEDAQSRTFGFYVRR